MPSRRAICLSLGSLAAVAGCLGDQPTDTADDPATATATPSSTVSESPSGTASATGTGTGIDGNDTLAAPDGWCGDDAGIAGYSFSVLYDAVGARDDKVKLSLRDGNEVVDTAPEAVTIDGPARSPTPTAADPAATATADTLVFSITGVVAEAATGASAYLDTFRLRDGVLRFRVFPGYDTPTPTEEQTKTVLGTFMGTAYRLVVAVVDAVPNAVVVEHREGWEKRFELVCQEN